MGSRVEVYSRRDCHLCDEALVVVAHVCAQTGESFVVTDIDAQPNLRERYGDDVPVVLVDGEVVAFWRVRAEQLTEALGRGGPL